MSRRRRFSFVAAFVAFAAGDFAAAQEKTAPETQEIASPDQSEKMRIPADWGVTAVGQTGSLLARWDIVLPDLASDASIKLQMRPGTRDERMGAASFGGGPGSSKEAASDMFVAQPIPHVVGERVFDGRVFSFCLVIRAVRRRGYLIEFECGKASFEKASAAFLASTATFRSARDEYPDMPTSYKTVLRDGYEYHLHPSVKDAAVDPIHRALMAQEASFAKRYGPVGKPPDDPIIVVVHETAADAATFESDLLKPKDGLLGDWQTGCLFALTTTLDDPRTAAGLAECFTFVLHGQVFGKWRENWHMAGDARVAMFESLAGRPFPQIAESLARRVPTKLPAFREVAEKTDFSESQIDEAMVYVAFFRSGAKPYADEFAAYVKDIRAAGNPDVAYWKHLASLDQEKLRAAAEAFMKSFKPIKGK